MKSQARKFRQFKPKQTCIPVPNFIRLFMMRRIISQYIKNNKHDDIGVTNTIKTLIVDWFKDDSKVFALAFNIVARLINDGLKEYMSKSYDEEEQTNFIEQLFHKIIINKFSPQYHQLVTYSSHDQSTKSITSSNINFKDNVFNTSDIMCKIFQYLQYFFFCRRLKGDLFSCSLVSTHFLYHVWNINSIYHVDLFSMIDDVVCLASKSSYKHINEDKMSRIWQRFFKAKSVNFTADWYLGDSDTKKEVHARYFLLNKLAMFTNIEKLSCEIRMNCFEQNIFETILNSEQWCEKIQEFKYKARMNPFGHSSLSTSSMQDPVCTLSNVKCITFESKLYHKIRWLRQCHTLQLCQIHSITQEWCDFMIANCDCSGITKFILSRSTFSNQLNDNLNSTDVDSTESKNKTLILLKKFANKFINLKYLQFVFYEEGIDPCVLLLWKFLKPITKRNKTQVDLKLYDHITDANYKKLNKIIQDENLKVDILYVSLDERDIQNKKNSVQSIENTLKICRKCAHNLTICYSDSQFIKLLKLYLRLTKGDMAMDDLSKIKVFQLNPSGYLDERIGEITDILGLNIFIEKRIFIIVNAYVYCSFGMVETEWKQFFDIVYQLMIKQLIPFDITITFDRLRATQYTKWYKIYSQYFGSTVKNLFQQYKEPRCNRYCTPLVEPQTSFVMIDRYQLHLKNASYMQSFGGN